MDVYLPLNTAVGAGVVLVAVAVGIMAKAATILEKSVDALQDFEDGIRDLRIATLALRAELNEYRATPYADAVQAAGPWPYTASPEG